VGEVVRFPEQRQEEPEADLVAAIHDLTSEIRELRSALAPPARRRAITP
jgi:hypothetical protein